MKLAILIFCLIGMALAQSKFTSKTYLLILMVTEQIFFCVKTLSTITMAWVAAWFSTTTTAWFHATPEAWRSAALAPLFRKTTSTTTMAARSVKTTSTTTTVAARAVPSSFSHPVSSWSAACVWCHRKWLFHHHLLSLNRRRRLSLPCQSLQPTTSTTTTPKSRALFYQLNTNSTLLLIIKFFSFLYFK